ncbi:hypothetical protein [Patulibacter americanus]|uniref:hypothetical protein n=1 Tax=Patulibacter americanus TaxID=588672 RepID=UPI000426027E|nr:hypothetical protein [Patulibacter americanus]
MTRTPHRTTRSTRTAAPAAPALIAADLAPQEGARSADERDELCGRFVLAGAR